MIYAPANRTQPCITVRWSTGCISSPDDYVTGMEANSPALSDDPVVLKAQVQALQNQVSVLEEQVRLLIQKRFGASSENLLLTNMACSMKPNRICLKTRMRLSQLKKRSQFLPISAKRPGANRCLHLSRIREEHGLPEDEKVCSCCGNQQVCGWFAPVPAGAVCAFPPGC